MSKSGSKKGYSTDELRNFYFSKATNYTSFNKSATNASAQRDRSEASLAASPSDVEVSITKTPHHQSAPRAVPSPISAATPADSSVTDLSAANKSVAAASNKSVAAAPDAAPASQKRVSAGSALSVAKANASTGSNGDGVSPAYISFLRQQQDLVKAHCGIDEIIQQFLDLSAERSKAHTGSVAQATELLQSAEASTEWNWKSKFSQEALAQDAGLVVAPEELRLPEDIPNIVDMQYQEQQLVKLKQAYCTDKNTQTSEFKLILENGIRRLERLTKEYRSSQLDATPVVRISDNLLVQLDHVMAKPPVEHILRDVNDSIVVLSQKQKECMDIRDQAHEDGVMDVAEKEMFRLADLSEELADTQCDKIRLLAQALDDNTVSLSVRDSYAKKAVEDASRIEAESAMLKSRCEADLARLYQLKKQVDTAEEAMQQRTQAERLQSDSRLDSIAKKQAEAWDQIAMLVKQIRNLENERHLEVKRRVEEKVKDETRRNEFLAFTDVTSKKAALYDLTVKNCDTNIHCTKLMAEFLQSGFFTIQKYLTNRKAEISDALLEAQKCHLQVFRSLLFTLGDLEYKKERKIEEVNEKIQAAHIQQEMCNDSLNPHAKKFSDMKKELLRLRDELDLELRDIRERQSVALAKYKPTDEALNKANVVHTHPLDDLEERRLSTRAKMVEYKAMALGHIGSVPVRNELESLKQSLNESRRVVSRHSVKAITE
jgi:hypothetical protein